MMYYLFLLILTCAYQPVCLVLFWMTSNEDPIKNLRPRLIFVANILNFLISFTYMTILSFPAFFKYVVAIFSLNLWITACAAMWVVITATLFVLYNHTNLHKRFSDARRERDSEREPELLQSLEKMRVFLSKKFTVAYVCFHCGIYAAVFAYFVSQQPDILNVSMDEYLVIARDSQESGGGMATVSTLPATLVKSILIFSNKVKWLVLIMISTSTLIMCGLAFQLQVVLDSSGIKQTLKRTAVSVLLCIVTYILFDRLGASRLMSRLMLLLTCHAIFNR